LPAYWRKLLRTNFYEKVKLGAAEAPEGIGAELDATVERSIDEAFVYLPTAVLGTAHGSLEIRDGISCVTRR
jgi:hypothetical protein